MPKLDKITGGAQVYLDDGSVYRYAYKRDHEVADWAPGDEITVKKSANPIYKLELVNVRTGGSTIATPSSGHL